MNRNEFENLLQSLADAWSRRDYNSAAKFFAEDVRYGDPLRYSFANRAQLQAFFEADEGYEQKTVWHSVIFDESSQTGAAEYTYEGTYRYHGVVLIRLKDNKIWRWREYQHIDNRDWQTFVSSTMFD
jgi:ketosteroid isomerase-like protein